MQTNISMPKHFVRYCISPFISLQVDIKYVSFFITDPFPFPRWRHSRRNRLRLSLASTHSASLSTVHMNTQRNVMARKDLAEAQTSLII